MLYNKMLKLNVNVKDEQADLYKSHTRLKI